MSAAGAEQVSSSQGWEAVKDAVFREIHAQLRSKEKRPILQADERAIALQWHRSGSPVVEYRIDEQRWWDPGTVAHAAALASRLLEGLREALRRADG